jgi:hypothetical protein
MEKLLGANWRTTVSGIGAGISSLLAVLATLSLTPEAQSVIAFLNDGQKKTVAIGSAIAALVFRFWNSLVQKDKSVTGGTTQQTADGSIASTHGQEESSSVQETKQAVAKK